MDDVERRRAILRARRRGPRIGRLVERRREGSVARVPRERVATTSALPGAEIVSTLGLVSVTVARSNDALRDVATAWRDTFGGRMGAFGKLADDAREEAVRDLREEAAKLGADAIVGVRIDVTAPTTSVLVVTASGTAVTL